VSQIQGYEFPDNESDTPPAKQLTDERGPG
jgi:hypothetical protein